MSSLDYYSYFAPLDRIVDSPLAGSSLERKSNDAINKNSFDEILKDYKNQAKNAAAESPKNLGCTPLTNIDCNAKNAIENGQKVAKNKIETAMQNILNADKPGFKRVLPFTNPDGSAIYDETPGTLEKTNWMLDLGISGKGEGFLLEDGSFTRDGRFKFGKDGRLVSVDGDKPLSIKYFDDECTDWSMKQLEIDFDGIVRDKLDGKKLGQIQVSMGPKAKLMQSYLEKSNVNMPVELMGLSQKVRELELVNNIQSTGTRLDNEAIQVIRGLQ
ncbi:MAG TPA: hypothetical protein V6C96_01475 [Vampirovibrionales bacterium]